MFEHYFQEGKIVATKFSYHVTAKEKALAEHYVYGTPRQPHTHCTVVAHVRKFHLGWRAERDAHDRLVPAKARVDVSPEGRARWIRKYEQVVDRARRRHPTVVYAIQQLVCERGKTGGAVERQLGRARCRA